MKKFLLTIALSCLLINSASAQTDSVEVYLIDSYATPELPHTFKLSFFTNLPTTSSIVIEDEYEYTITTELSELHKAGIDLTSLKFDDKTVNFIIINEDSLGNIFKSEIYDFDLPFEPEIESESSLISLCIFGGTIFLLPMPGYVNYDGESYFSLTKEIPVISFRSKSIKYPSGYLSLEYTHIINAPNNKFFRAGYKKIYELSFFRYLSPGITAFTNFNGHNGIAPEISLGIFTIEDTFTFYTRYRFNYKPGDSKNNIHEVYIGLYSGFLSIYL